jgi:hypothetical protein
MKNLRRGTPGWWLIHAAAAAFFLFLGIIVRF